MVAQRYLHVQGGDGPHALAGWGHPDLPPLTAGEMRSLLRRSQAHTSTRMVYATFLIYADGAGFVFATMSEIAEETHLTYSGVRQAIAQLVRAGEVVRVRRGGPGQLGIWRIVGVAERAA